jgi:hypothetical protein
MKTASLDKAKPTAPAKGCQDINTKHRAIAALLAHSTDINAASAHETLWCHDRTRMVKWFSASIHWGPTAPTIGGGCLVSGDVDSFADAVRICLEKFDAITNCADGEQETTNENTENRR